MVKCEMSKMIGEMVYEMPSIYFSFLSFRNIFSCSRQFNDKCIAGLRIVRRFSKSDEGFECILE